MITDIQKNIAEKYQLKTEELLKLLAERLDLDADNRKFYEALGMISVAHAGDNRREIDSCLSHLLRVSLFVSDCTQHDMTMVTTALLHDVVEDYPAYLHGTEENLWQCVLEGYGKVVHDALRVLTNPPEVEKEEREKHERPSQYHAHLAHILEHPQASLIKLADFCDNIMVITLSSNQQFVNEIGRRYVPVMPLFLETFKDSEVTDHKSLRDYFMYVESHVPDVPRSVAIDR